MPHLTGGHADWSELLPETPRPRHFVHSQTLSPDSPDSQDSSETVQPLLSNRTSYSSNKPYGTLARIPHDTDSHRPYENYTTVDSLLGFICLD